MYNFIKRVIDLSVSSIALILLSPFLLPITLLLRLTGEGEVFYLQNRIGLKNNLFSIWKFATMLKNSEKIGTGSITVRNDPRVTPMGTFLRKTKINELPQIINVLIGNMSIVGPRPLLKVDFEKYTDAVQKVIYNSKPGITGVGSVVFRDEELLVSTANIPPQEYYKKYIMPYKGELEMWYQQNKSIWVDFTIIFLTAYSIVVPHNNLAHKLLKNLPERPDFNS